MTEADWQSSTDPGAMLAYLRERGLASERRLKLFLAAVTRVESWSGEEWMWHFSTTSRYIKGRGQECAAFIREIWGNPWRPVTICPDYYHDTPGGNRIHIYECPDPSKGQHSQNCVLSHPGIIAHARHIYEARDWELMPILADALTEAGCSCQAILDHCRGLEPVLLRNLPRQIDIGPYNYEPWLTKWIPLRSQHTRGCWALSLILRND